MKSARKFHSLHVESCVTIAQTFLGFGDELKDVKMKQTFDKKSLFYLLNFNAFKRLRNFPKNENHFTN